MYKKIKATKNNSLKKASVLMSVAVLASCVVFMKPGDFGIDDGSTVSAWGDDLLWSDYDSLWDDDSSIFKRSRFGDSFFGNKFRGVKKSDLLNNQEALNNLSWFKELSERTVKFLDFDLNPRNIFARTHDKSFQGSFRETAATKTIEKLFYDKKTGYMTLVEAARHGTNLGEDPKTIFQYLLGVSDKVMALQEYVGKLIIQAGQLIRLDKLSDSEAAGKLARDIKDKILLDSDMLKYSGIESVCAGKGRDRDLAQSIHKQAMSLFFAGKTFADKRDDDLTAQVDWDALFYERYGREYSSPSLRAYQEFLQTLLCFNAAIRSYQAYAVAQLFAFATAVNLKRIFYSNLDAARVIARDKTALFIALNDHGAGELAALIPLLMDFDKSAKFANSFSGFDGASINKKKVEDLLGNALNPGQKGTPEQIYQTMTLYSGDGLRRSNDPRLEYDIASVFRSILGDKGARAALGELDSNLGQMLQDPSIEYMKNRQNLSDEVVEFFGKAKDDFANGSQSLRYIAPNGEFVRSVVDANYGGYNTKLIYKALCLPTGLRIRGMFKAYRSLLASNYSNSEFWDSSFKEGLSFESILGGVSSFISKISESVTSMKDIGKKVAKAKKESKKDENKNDKEELNRKLKNRLVTHKIALTGGNTHLSGITSEVVEARGEKGANTVSFVIRNLPKEVTKIWPALCPKVVKDGKSVNKDMNLPVVNVVNGTCAIDLTGLLQEDAFYELHIRSVLEMNGDNPSKADFLAKFKFHYGNASAQYVKRLTEPKVEQASGSPIDYNSLKIFERASGEYEYFFKLKEGVTDFDPENIMVVYFKQGVAPNLEKDIYAIDRHNSEWYSFISPATKDPDMQSHFYQGNVGGVYLGKALTSTSHLKDITKEEKDSEGLKGILTKVTDKDFVTVKTEPKTLKFSLVDWDGDGLLKNEPVEIEYSVLDDKGKVMFDAKSEAKSVSSKGMDRKWNGLSSYDIFSDRQSIKYTFDMKVDIPDVESDGSKGNYNIVINRIGDHFCNYKTASSLNKETSSETTIKLSAKRKNLGSKLNFGRLSSGLGWLNGDDNDDEYIDED